MKEEEEEEEEGLNWNLSISDIIIISVVGIIILASIAGIYLIYSFLF